MLQCFIMKTKSVLSLFLALMAALIVLAVLFRAEFLAFLNQPALYSHVRFVHIAAVSLFFANAVLGMVWERRSLASGRKDVILHTYGTVAWLDARLSSPLIVLSVLSGLSLSVQTGELWQIGWLSVGFILFLLSGVFWVVSDIPTQYRVKKLTEALDPADERLPEELTRLLNLRWWISLAGLLPLAVVFMLMVYKPALPALGLLFP